MVNRLMRKRKGFTVIEVLTAVAIVAIMVAILIPSVAQVRKFARKVSQKAQMNSLSIGLEMFKNDFNRYPDSGEFDRGTNSDVYNGAQKLAEAMFGQDLLGVHPAVASDFDYNGSSGVYLDDGTYHPAMPLYTKDGDLLYTGTGWQTLEENIACRKGPYVEPEKANATDLRDIYDNLPNSFKTSASNTLFVITDVYKKKNSTYFSAMRNLGLTGSSIGMPILYFKANTSKIQQRQSNDHAKPVNSERIYDVLDNKDIYELGSPWNGAWDGTKGVKPDEYLGETTNDDDNMKIFADMIVNPKLYVGTMEKPYNPKGFILVSAGEDGFYGTADDVFNFDKEQ